MYKHDLALNNLHKLICHKTQPANQYIYIYIEREKDSKALQTN